MVILNEDNNNFKLLWKELIIFDLYWTCIKHPTLYFEDKYKQALLHIFRKQKADTSPIELVDILNDDTIKNTWLDTNFIKDNIQENINQSKLFPDFLWTIENIKSKWYRTAIASNLIKCYEKPVKRLIPEWTFDYEALSFNVWAKKPNKKIFDYLQKISWISFDKMVMIWDSFKSDVLWAKNSGIDPVYLRRDEKWIEDKNIIQISTLSDLIKILQ